MSLLSNLITRQYKAGTRLNQNWPETEEKVSEDSNSLPCYVNEEEDMILFRVFV